MKQSQQGACFGMDRLADYAILMVVVVCEMKFQLFICKNLVNFSRLHKSHVRENFLVKFAKLAMSVEILSHKLSLLVFCSFICRRMYFDNHQMCYYL